MSPRDLSGGGLRRDRRHIRRAIGGGFDNVIDPPIEITPPPVDPPDPPDPPVVRGSNGQQRSAYVHARNAARQETHGHKVTVTSADPTKVRIDEIDGNLVLFTVLDGSVVTNLIGDVDGIAIPTVYATGPGTPIILEPAGLVSAWYSDVGVTTSGSEVTGVADQVNSNNLIKNGATGPTLVANAINGLPAFHPSATSAQTLKAAISQLNGKTAYSLVFVRTPYNDTTNVQRVWMSLEDGVGPALGLGQGSTNDFRVGGLWNATFQTMLGVYRGNSVTNLFDIIVLTRNGATVTCYKNGAPIGTFAAGSASAIPNPVAYLGGDRAGNPGGGYWAAGRVYDHALSAADVLTVSQILGTKYNIPVQGTAGTLISRAGWVASAWADGGGGFVPASAIDSNIGTRYLSAANVVANTSWFKIDMGSAQLVGGVRCDDNPVNGGGWAQPVSGNVQWSDDNSSWTTVATWALGTTTATVQASWTPESHRYWRLLATGANSDGGWWSIGEIYFYSDRAP